MVKQPSFTEGIGWYKSGGGICTHLVGKVRRNIDVRRYVPPHTFTGARSNGATVYKACSVLSWQFGIYQVQSATEGAPGRPDYEPVGRGASSMSILILNVLIALFLRRYRLCSVVIQSTDGVLYVTWTFGFLSIATRLCLYTEHEMNLTIY